VAEINRVVNIFATALANGRFEDACALMTDSAQEAMDDGHGSCEAGAQVLSRNVGARTRHQWREMKILDIDSTGDEVTVASEDIVPRWIFGGMELRRVSGKWLVHFDQESP
jgi:hypothetical protein